ncbi:hypothetical protein IVB69_11330 [Flavobacterium sp. J49]|uniref:hypothetical protein n=1 Tax=Flavobacterium sp. J49 TaxID=2718534 RepID=UPI001593FA55|nr:hypothetical protein [Flavobacterium sp. J49]MBF6642074.1 hypothetical protein [Flavobacterium sp. J49]
MKTNNETEELNQLILVAQEQNESDLRELKAQFQLTYDSLKPSNIIKNVFQSVINTPDIKDNLVSAAIGLTSGIVGKKLIVGSSNSPARKVLGTVLQFAVTNWVSKYSIGFSTIAGNLFKSFFDKQKQ